LFSTCDMLPFSYTGPYWCQSSKPRRSISRNQSTILSRQHQCLPPMIRDSITVMPRPPKEEMEGRQRLPRPTRTSRSSDPTATSPTEPDARSESETQRASGRSNKLRQISGTKIWIRAKRRTSPRWPGTSIPTTKKSQLRFRNHQSSDARETVGLRLAAVKRNSQIIEPFCVIGMIPWGEFTSQTYLKSTQSLRSLVSKWMRSQTTSSPYSWRRSADRSQIGNSCFHQIQMLCFGRRFAYIYVGPAPRKSYIVSPTLCPLPSSSSNGQSFSISCFIRTPESSATKSAFGVALLPYAR